MRVGRRVGRDGRKGWQNVEGAKHKRSVLCIVMCTSVCICVWTRARMPHTIIIRYSSIPNDNEDRMVIFK